MEFQQPSIHVWGIRIDEPVTVLTDLLVTAVCFYAFYRIRQYPVKNKIKYFLLIYFLSMGLATAIGGIIGHGFLHYLSFAWKLPGWATSMISVAFLERACIEQARPHISKRLSKFFGWLNIIELLTFMAISFITLDFFYVEVHSAYGILVIVLSFSIYLYRKTGNRGNLMFIIAVAFSAIAALFFMNKIGLHKWFNHFDISHTFMSISAWFFYRGSQDVIYSKVEAGGE